MTYASMRYVRSPSSGLKDSTCYPAFSIAPAMNPHTMCFCQPIFAMISEMVCAVLALEHRDHLGGLGTLARPGSLLAPWRPSCPSARPWQGGPSLVIWAD